MDLNVAGALSSYAYQSALAKTGNKGQALAQAMAVSQSQSSDASLLLASTGSVDPMSALLGGSTSEALNSLSYSMSAASGNGSQAIQALLASPGSSASSLFSGTDSLPLSAAVLSPASTQALVRYAYDQSQNSSATVEQAIASSQQAIQGSVMNLLA